MKVSFVLIKIDKKENKHTRMDGVPWTGRLPKSTQESVGASMKLIDLLVGMNPSYLA